MFWRASHDDGFSSLLYSAVDILRRLSLADWGMGADLIAAFVASCMYLGMGFGPWAWEGHVREK